MNDSGVMEAMKANPAVPMSSWQGKKVTVFGLGRSGQAAADLLLDRGATVTLIEEHPRPEHEVLKNAYEHKGVRICIGGNLEPILNQSALLVVSPGVPYEHHVLQQAREKEIPVIGEIELAARFLQAPIIAVTGTNGKSTTVRLIGSILQASGKHVFVGGNLGLPLCDAVPRLTDSPQATAYEFIVAEVSSFQLETIQSFKPWIAVLLNVTPDHLDRHPTQEVYQAAKRRIFENQTEQDWMVINADDPIVKAMAQEGAAQVYEFSLCHEMVQGMYLDGPVIRSRLAGKDDVILHREDIPMRGQHNVANAMAAMSVAVLCGSSNADKLKALQNFPVIEHALEFVRSLQGVTFINDSKGTNVDATLKALQSFSERVVLILGGKDKGGDFTRLLDAICEGVKGLVLIGEAAPRIQHALKNTVPITIAHSLEDAVRMARSLATSGDVVLFSPACASFDMFQNYHHRGLEFKRIVRELH